LTCPNKERTKVQSLIRAFVAEPVDLLAKTADAPPQRSVALMRFPLRAPIEPGLHLRQSRRKWRKLHWAVDAINGMIVAQTLTDQGADDPSQVAPLLDQIGECPETVGIWQASI
jgi:hypothetical protein